MEKTAQQTKARQEDATPPIPGETAERDHPGKGGIRFLLTHIPQRFRRQGIQWRIEAP